MPLRCRRSPAWPLLLGLCLLSSAAGAAAPAAERAEGADGLGLDAQGRRGVVVSATLQASRIGRDVLETGGTAVDAAVAVAFALAVTWPEAGNIGGGGFMMIQPPGGSAAVCVDYRETAPAAAAPDMFSLDADRFTHPFVGVPGTVRGLALAHQRFGRLPWADLVRPAVGLAEAGFVVDRHLAASLNNVLGGDRVQHEPRYAELRRVFGRPGGGLWRPGDRLRQPELAAVLNRIAQSGPDGFYRGPTADRIVAEMRRGGGLITHADLAGYRAKIRAPIRGRYREFDILGAPPPSSGGICVVEAMNVLERFSLRRRGRYSPPVIHLAAETMRRVFRDRALHLGDPAFTPIPEHLTDKAYAARLAESIAWDRATPSETLAPPIQLADEAPCTTHFSVIDAEGMGVANTYTLEQSYGSRIVVRGGGFLLNNEMGDFNWVAGHTDRQGRIGTAPNLIAPGKRMLSSQSPTIVLRDGRIVLLTGSPGGRTIINTVITILLNRLEFGMDLRAAVDGPRMHHQWLPDRLELERADRPPHRDAVAPLRAMGHQVRSRTMQGSAHSIGALENGLYRGAADRRRGGWAAAARR